MNNLILKEVGRIIIPFIQIFSIYIMLHGHLSPGGGFAGGTVLGTSFILYRMINGREKTREKLSYKNLMTLMCSSLILYGLLKGYSFITGGSHMHVPQIPLGTPGKILSGGYLLPLNIFVGMIVGVAVYFFFSLFYEGEI